MVAEKHTQLSTAMASARRQLAPPVLPRLVLVLVLVLLLLLSAAAVPNHAAAAANEDDDDEPTRSLRFGSASEQFKLLQSNAAGVLMTEAFAAGAPRPTASCLVLALGVLFAYSLSPMHPPPLN
jgi:hypothetical protein